MAQTKATVSIVDDDEATGLAISDLGKTVGLNSKTYLSGQEFLDNFAPEEPGCLVLDVRMPGMSGFELHAKLLKMNACPSVIFITAYADVTMAVDAMKNGAVDFIEKPFRNQTFVDSIQRAVALDAKRRDIHAEKERIRTKLNLVTAREMQIMDLLLEGRTNKAVAHHLGISTKTVDYHRSRIIAKMQVENMIQLSTQIVRLRTL